MSAKINGKESSFPLTPITKKTGQLAETISFHKLPTANVLHAPFLRIAMNITRNLIG